MGTHRIFVMGEDSGWVLFDADHHGLWTEQVFHAGLTETDFLHPTDAIVAGVIESAGSFNQHIQAHEQAEGILRAIVIDEGFVDDHGAAGVEGFVGFTSCCIDGMNRQDLSGPDRRDVLIGGVLTELRTFGFVSKVTITGKCFAVDL